jgi:hypothetical protein
MKGEDERARRWNERNVILHNIQWYHWIRELVVKVWTL